MWLDLKEKDLERYYCFPNLFYQDIRYHIVTVVNYEDPIYRYFQNNSGGSKTAFSVTINGSGTIVASGTSFNSSTVGHVVEVGLEGCAGGLYW